MLIESADCVPCSFLALDGFLLQYHPIRKELSMSLIQPIKYLKNKEFQRFLALLSLHA